MSDRAPVEALTLDFFNTLVRHREGRGRGGRVSEYLCAQGYQPRPWDHRILYRVFQRHAVDYAPDLSGPARRRYLADLACQVFEELGVDISRDDASMHAERLWEILGPSSFEVFADVSPTLESLRVRGIRLAVISNWHCGLRHFLTELGLAPYFEHVVGSADCGFAKPSPGIFENASHLLGVASDRILHVGDSFDDDYVAGRAAGYRAVLLERQSGEHEVAAQVVQSLAELCRLPELAGAFPDRAT